MSVHNKHLNSKSIWDTLNRVQYAMNLDDRSFADRLSLTFRHFQMLKARNITPNLFSFHALLDEIQLLPETFIQGQIDFAALSAVYSGNKNFVRERYRPGAFSKKRTLWTPLQYIREYLGTEEFLGLLKHLQIREAFFSNEDEVVNVRLMADLCDYLASRFGQTQILYSMGSFSNQSTKNSVISQQIGSGLSVKNTYEKIVIDLAPKYLDKNLIYSFETLTNEGCLLVGTPNPEVQDALSQENIGSPSACVYRAGVIASLPAFSGLPHAHAEEISCVNRGDKTCIYRVGFAS